MGYPVDRNGESCSQFHTGDEHGSGRSYQNDHRNRTHAVPGCYCTYCDRLRANVKRVDINIPEPPVVGVIELPDPPKLAIPEIPDIPKLLLPDIPVPPTPGMVFIMNETKPTVPRAPDFLRRAADAMDQRAALRDSPQGERSMARATAMFRALYDLSEPGDMQEMSKRFGREEAYTMSELAGWHFMICLKMARSIHGKFNADDYDDMAAYAALAGECAAQDAS